MHGADFDRALIWAVHRTENWWRHVGHNLGFSESTVITDRRGRGDRWLTDDFYAAYRGLGNGTERSPFSEAELDDVVARCRTLRWTPQARRMAAAMAIASDRMLDRVNPDVFLCFPIDSYVSDVIARRARSRGIPTFEVTVSALPGMAMLMHRGRLITSDIEPDAAAIAARVREIADPLFAPIYVQNQAPFTPARFARIFGYFQIRGILFKAWSYLVRDPLRCHLLDAQPGLGHKPHWSDIAVLDLIDQDWESRIAAMPSERRVLFGLQLFPEAAIDYWIESLDLVRHEEMLIDAARTLTDGGYMVVVKDHPLQFGFRQVKLIRRLKMLPNVVIVPYQISGNAMLSVCGASLTATGTLGLQGALFGNASIVGEAYYANERDFIVLKTAADVAGLPAQLGRWERAADLDQRQRRIVSQLLRGSFDADYWSYRGFDPGNPHPAAAEFGRALGKQIRKLGPAGEDWHGRHMPPDGGRHAGSPLN